jgi:UDP-glucose 4-epimerase
MRFLTTGGAGSIGSHLSERLLDLNHLAKQVIRMTNSCAKIVHIRYREADGPGFEDMDRRVLDISKAGKVLGSTRKLEEIIESVIDRKKGAKTAQLTWG